MLHETAQYYRAPKHLKLHSDLIVVGGGMAGICSAITAARSGIKVILVQDRPVLGGNASSEVRLWILGATSHMGNNNRWAREGGVIDEILVENTYRNPEGNGIILDTILLELLIKEPNITLLLNTAVYDLKKKDKDSIQAVIAFCSQNSTQYELEAPLFCDASGDGIVGFLAGAAFRMGAESADEFDEPFAPAKEYGHLLGHSIYFMTKDVGKPVNFIAPSFAIDVVKKIPRYRKFNTKDFGAHLWWIEYGGRLDTVHDTETIKWELWKVVYGVWDYIKNSGKFPEAETMTLEWVGQIPGKRESRRFEGHYMLKQSDFVTQRQFSDAVSLGGWAVDLHPADGVFSEKPGCNQYHSKGVYQVPYRSMISKNIDNLFLAGRIISATHVAMGSTRVMATCAHNAQAVGVAAALATQKNLKPAELVQPEYMHELQQSLLSKGQFIPHVKLKDPKDMVQEAKIYACKRRPEIEQTEKIEEDFRLSEIPFDGDWIDLTFSSAQLLPLKKGPCPSFELSLRVAEKTSLTCSLRISSKAANFTPDEVLESLELVLNQGQQEIELSFKAKIPHDCYVFICFHKNEYVSLRSSKSRISGLLSVFNKENKAVGNFGKQMPEGEIGFEEFEFWVPIRRPDGPNFAMKINPALPCFGIENLRNGFQRPFIGTNVWLADPDSQEAELCIEWPEIKKISEVHLAFDTDFDHPMESSIWGHPEPIMPFTIREFEISDERGNSLYHIKDNHQTLCVVNFSTPVEAKKLFFRFKKPMPQSPIAVFEIRCYSPQ